MIFQHAETRKAAKPGRRRRIATAIPAARRAAAVLCAVALAACGGAEEAPSDPGFVGEAPSAAIDPPAQPEITWATLDGAAPMIIAHRGASGARPEHTLEAYQLALDSGADAIEPDLVMTKDGVLVARHDRYLSTTTNVAELPAFADRKRADRNAAGDGRVDWWIEDFTIEEVKSLRARQPRDGRPTEFDDQFSIPTFDEILLLAVLAAEENLRPVAIYPETKHPDYFASIGLEFETPLLTGLSGYEAGPVYIQSFAPGILRRLRDKTTASLVQLVNADGPDGASNLPIAEIAAFADGVGAEKSLLVGEDGCATGFVAEAHKAGLFVHAWTFRDDSPPTMGTLTCAADFRDPASEIEAHFKLGVDGAFTDFPATGIAARERMLGRAAPPETDVE